MGSLGTQLVYDSGSPMVCQDNNDNNAMFVGVQSLVHQTNISYFSKWITDTVVTKVAK